MTVWGVADGIQAYRSAARLVDPQTFPGGEKSTSKRGTPAILGTDRCTRCESRLLTKQDELLVPLELAAQSAYQV